MEPQTLVDSVISEYKRDVAEEGAILRGQDRKLEAFQKAYPDRDAKTHLAQLKETDVAAYQAGALVVLALIESAENKEAFIKSLATNFEQKKSGYLSSIGGAASGVEKDNIVQSAAKAFQRGFKDGAEALLKAKFSSKQSELPAAEMRRLVKALDEVGADYLKSIQAEGYKFEYEDYKMDDYAEHLRAGKCPEEEIKSRQSLFHAKIVSNSHNSFQAGLKAALDNVAAHSKSVDKKTLLTLVRSAHETEKPHYAKKISAEQRKILEEYEKSMAAEEKKSRPNITDAELEALLGAYQTAMVFLFNYRIAAFDRGFKEGVEHLIYLQQETRSVPRAAHSVPQAQYNRFSRGLELLVEAYQENVASSDFKLKGQDQRLAELRAQLATQNVPEEQLEGKLQSHQALINTGSVKGYKDGCQAALEGLVANYDLQDKKTLVVNLNHNWMQVFAFYEKRLQTVAAEALAAVAEGPLRARTRKETQNLNFFQAEGFKLGFKNATEYLLGVRFPQRGSLHHVSDENKEKIKLLNTTLRTLLEDFEAEDYRFRGMEEKTAEFKAVVEAVQGSDVKAELKQYKQAIHLSACAAHSEAARLVLECIVSNIGVSKAAMVHNLSNTFETHRPSYVKEVKRNSQNVRLEAKQAAATAEAKAAVEVKVAHLEYFKLKAYGLGFKGAAEVLMAAWKPSVNPELPSPQKKRGSAAGWRGLGMGGMRVDQLRQENQRLKERLGRLEKLVSSQDARIVRLERALLANTNTKTQDGEKH